MSSQRAYQEKKGHSSYEDYAGGWLSSKQFSLSLVSADSDLMSIVRIPMGIARLVTPFLDRYALVSLTRPTAWPGWTTVMCVGDKIERRILIYRTISTIRHS